MSITLYVKKGSPGCTFTQSEPNLQDKDGNKFTIADVTAGNWIFYTLKDYNKDKGPHSYKRVMGVEKHVNIKDVNGSVFLVNPVDELILFEHFGYGGKSKRFGAKQKDLTDSFPPEGQGKSNVSSAILLSKDRSVVLFNGTDFAGNKQYTMQPGEWCEKLNVPGGLNDNCLSFKFI